MKVDVRKSTYISRKLVEKVTKYHPISLYKNPIFPETQAVYFENI